MGKKGVPHRRWSKEEKLRIVNRHLDEHIATSQIEREEGVSNKLVSAWVKVYLEDGADALGPKNGNPYATLGSGLGVVFGAVFTVAGGLCVLSGVPLWVVGSR